MSTLRKIRRSGKTTPNQNVKLVSFESLKGLSDYNVGRFNQNIDYQDLENNFKGLDEHHFEIIRVMDHFHFQGKPIPKHYRCLVRHPKNIGFRLQDVSIEQWNSM